MLNNFKGSLSPIEWGAGGMVVGVGLVAIAAERGVGYLIVLAVGIGAVISIRGVMRRMLLDAIEFGAESEADRARRAAQQGRTRVAPVYRLADRKRQPAQR